MHCSQGQGISYLIHGNRIVEERVVKWAHVFIIDDRSGFAAFRAGDIYLEAINSEHVVSPGQFSVLVTCSFATLSHLGLAR